MPEYWDEYGAGTMGYSDGDFNGWCGNGYDDTMGDDSPEYQAGYAVGYTDGEQRRLALHESLGREGV